jgi:hypothetical protein
LAVRTATGRFGRYRRRQGARSNSSGRRVARSSTSCAAAPVRCSGRRTSSTTSTVCSRRTERVHVRSPPRRGGPFTYVSFCACLASRLVHSRCLPNSGNPTEPHFSQRKRAPATARRAARAHCRRSPGGDCSWGRRPRVRAARGRARQRSCAGCRAPWPRDGRLWCGRQEPWEHPARPVRLWHARE